MQRPPRLFLRFLRWFCHEDYLEEVEGDLTEVFKKQCEDSPRLAKWRFALSVIRYLRPEFMKSFKNSYQPYSYGMYKSYFKIGWRNLLQAKLVSVIKILGLSIGLTVCMLILLYTKDEVSYDRFHTNKDRIYRVVQTWQFGTNPPQIIGTTNAVVGETFAREIPEIQQYIRVNGVPVTVKMDDDVFTENPLFVDSNFFSVFTFPLAAGNKRNALKDLHAVVLSKDIAKKYFGTLDVLGKSIQLKLGDEFDDFTITALTDNSPQNSTLKVDMLLPFDYYEKRYNNNRGWMGGSMNTFLLISPQANVREVENKMQTLFDRNIKERLAKVREEQSTTLDIRLALQPLTSIHLSADAGPDNGLTDGSNSAYSYILTSIAVFILLIACINFISLAIAQSLKRSKEIGIRKVVGSTRSQLVSQFLSEAFLFSSIAFCFAIPLTIAVTPFFNELANKKLSLFYLSDNYWYGGYFLLLISAALIAGFYPSLVLSNFQPVKVLYSRHKLMGKNYFTRGLVILQFALAIFLVIGAMVINSQMEFLFNVDLGYNSRNLVRIDIPVSKSSDQLPALFKNELANKKNIVSVAARNGGRSITSIKANGKMIEIENNKIDDRFFSTFEIPLIAGRNFSSDRPSDLVHSVIVNESLIKEAGWQLEEAIGKTINFHSKGNRPATIVGIIRDYHFVSLKEKIGPALFSMNPEFNFGQIWVRIRPEDTPHTLALLKNTYQKLVPLFPYSFQFMDDINTRNYETELKWKQMITVASGLFIFISCIGLFGLVVLSIEQRTKEIGIRKILGAAASGIVALISKEFALLICIAFALATPAGYFVLKRWLQNFAYRIDLYWWMFALSGTLVIAIALLIVSLQAVKAAFDNPVKNLRSE